MAQAIVLPLFEKGYFQSQEVLGIVSTSKSVKQLLERCPKGMKVIRAINSEADKVWDIPVQLLAVKPQNLDSVSEKYRVRKEFNSSHKPLLISLLAGVSITRLQSLFPHHCCVRAVPNTPVLVSAGITGLSWGDGVSTDQKLIVQEIFHPISEVLELQEDQLDAFLALTSSGPAYLALIAEALADGAVAAGLSRSLAQYLAHRTISGTAKLLKEKDLHPGELKDMVASPAGTTMTALRHLEMSGVRSALIEAVVLAAERSRQMA